MKPNHHLDFVRIKLITEKRLYSEEELTSSQKVVQFISKELAECDREVLCILNCNAKCQVINMNVVSMGSLTETLVTGRELFKSAILSNARGVILIHNHPSGNFTPSKEDFLVTTKMCIGGDILGIDVWDHIIMQEEVENVILWQNREKCRSSGTDGKRRGSLWQIRCFSHQRRNNVLGNTCKRYRRNGFVEMLESLLMFG